MTLLYRGSIARESQVEVELNNNSDKAEIGMLFLQYGYKLYGPNYNLIDTTDTTCIN